MHLTHHNYLPVNIDVSVFRLKRVVIDSAAAAAQPLQPDLLPLRVRVDRAARRPAAEMGQLWSTPFFNIFVIKLVSS